MKIEALHEPWEHDEAHAIFLGLVGFEYGPNPELHIDEIRAWRARIIDHFDKCFLRLTGSETVLEIGSGCGLASRELSRRAQQLYCVDVSEAYLRWARRECAELSNVTFHQTSLTDLSFLASDSIDAVVASAVFIHMELFAINLFFKQLARVVRPGGRVVFDFFEAERLDPMNSIFAAHTEDYRKNPHSYPELCKWNSKRALCKIAKQYGFAASTFPRKGFPNTMFYAVKTSTAAWLDRWQVAVREYVFDKTHATGYTTARPVMRE